MNTISEQKLPIKAIIGLGNPGNQYYYTRHNIGFRVVDALAQKYYGAFKKNDCMEQATITINQAQLLLIKPQTFMNDSGKVIPFLQKKGITSSEILVVHDELELPFGEIKFKTGGSAKGHNGLKSIIEMIGPDFHRLRVGIGRPQNRDDVPNYVLQKFKESTEEVEQSIENAITAIETHVI